MNKRVKKLLETVRPGKYIICTEKGRLLTESYKSTEREPEVLRNAKALAHVLDNVTIFIEDGELIVGNASSRPRGIEFTDLWGIWTEQEIAWIKAGEGFEISKEDEAELLSWKGYWKGKTFMARSMQLFDEERIWPYVELGVVLPALKSRDEEHAGGGLAGNGWGIRPEHGSILVIPDYSTALYKGTGKIIEEAEKELRNTKIKSEDAVHKVDFLKSVIIAHKAIIRFANRFADLAALEASKETDPDRKQELNRIAEICRRVPEHPAENFDEAMQSFWFIFLMLNPNNVVSYGRFDQLMYPFYKKDKDGGRITDDQAKELIELLRIKDMQTLTTGGKSQREKWSGLAKWHNMIIGGQTVDGSDATNELTYLILEAARDCPTPHHTISLRVHERTPEPLMTKALEVVKTGIGMPAFIGDRGHIEFLLSYGISPQKARDYALAGCLDVNLPGDSRNCAYPMFIVARAFDIFMHNGRDPKTGKQVAPEIDVESITSFSELLRAFKGHILYWMDRHAEFNNIYLRVYTELYPQPVDSSFMSGWAKAGKDFLNRPLPLENAAVMNAVGMINTADSFTAIKRLVFEDGKVTMKELKAALDANWEGNRYSDMRKMFMSAPKYGNNDDYADMTVKELYSFWADASVRFDSYIEGAKHIPSAISISASWPGGEETGATPDGRYSGECLADGTMSAMRGMDVHGPTALIMSASKVDQVPISTTLMNMKFHPSALKSTDDLRKLSSLIKTYFSLGGKHIQFNIVDRQTMLNAQEKPQNHKDLIVRVAGYSAYFVQLGKAVQDDIIARTEHQHPA
jgi:pyruvate formate-lyase/glycerol dehydratase family glycyl radical enzyme